MGTVSFWEDGHVLKMDGGDGCTTLQMCLIPLNCILQMVKMIKFICIFFYNLKTLKTKMA